MWSARTGAPSFEDFAATLPFPPTDEQRAVIESTAPALLVVAGAGSGKTATMSQRIAWHVAAGHVRSGEVLGLTFTRKAAGELAERVAAQLASVREAGLVPDDGVGDEPPTVATYNSFASDIAASYALLIGEDPRSRLITEAERQQIMDRIVKEWVPQCESDIDAEHPFIRTAHTTIVDVALSLAAAITDNNLTTARVREFLHSDITALQSLMKAKETVDFRKKPYRGTEIGSGYSALNVSKALESLRLREAAMDLVDAYFSYKRENSLVEFADQVAWAGKILRAAPEIGMQLRSRFKLILLDEYQDTSPNQAQFLRAAFYTGTDDEPTCAVESEDTRPVSVCAVGDPNQAIYGWRGAGADSLADFSREFAVTPEAHFTLSESFRNSTKILAVANALTAHSSPVDLEQLMHEKFPTVSVLERPWIAKMNTHAQLEELHVPQLRPTKDANQGRVIHVHRNFSADAYLAIASRIAQEFSTSWQEYQRRACAASAVGQSMPPYQPPTAAVLVRKRKYVQPMIEALQRQGLTYVNMTGDMFGAAPEIRVVRALLGVAFSPARGDLLMQVLNFYALGADDVRALEKIRNMIPAPDTQRTSLVEALNYVSAHANDPDTAALFTPVGYKRVQRIAAGAERLRKLGQLPVADIVRFAIDELELFELAASRVDGGARVEQMLSALLAAASSFDQHIRATEAAGQLPIQSFLQWLEVAEKKERSSVDEDVMDSSTASAPNTAGDIEPEAGVVQILTVHAAKGLEWDIVAIPEMVHGEFDAIYPGEVNPWHKDKYALPWPLRADHEHLPSMPIADAVPTDAASPEQVVVTAGGKFWAYLNGPLTDYENANLRRLAYVALTRARSTLIMGTYSYSSWGKVQAIAEKMESTQKTEQKKSSSGRSARGGTSAWEPVQCTFIADIQSGVPSDTVTLDGGDSAPLETSEQFLQWVHSEAENRPHESSISPAESSSVLNKLEILEKVIDACEKGEEIEQGLALWPQSVQRSLNSGEAAVHDVDPRRAALWRRNTLLVLAEQQDSAPARSPIDYLTASDVVALRADPDAFARERRRPIPHEPSRAAQRGTAVHAKIAQAFHRPSVLDIDAVAAPDEMPLDVDLRLSDARAEQLYQRAMDSRFAAMEPIAIEQRLDITVAGYPVRCVIDAVFTSGKSTQNGYRSRKNEDDSSGDGSGSSATEPRTVAEPKTIIVDWKTGKRPPAQQLRSRYLQLELYRLAWAKAHHSHPESIDAYFYYLGEDDPDQRELRSEPMSQEQLESEVRDMLTTNMTEK